MTALHLHQAMRFHGKSSNRLYGKVADKDSKGRDGKKVEELSKGHRARERINEDMLITVVGVTDVLR